MSTIGIVNIDLGAIADNWSALNGLIGVSSQCGAVVKANAYGLGVGPVAKSLFLAGCREFFVATLAEGEELRSYLPNTAEIIVFGGLSHDPSGLYFQHWQDYQLTPVLFSVEHITSWAEHCSELGRVLPCAVKIDSGMHRLGMQPKEIDELLRKGLLEAIKPKYVMSHFACADKPSHPLNSQQIAVFSECVKKITQCLPSAVFSLCNSSGIFLSDEVHYDLVRPGVALYGANPTDSLDNPMKAVVSLSLPIIQIRVISDGETVGYGAEFVAERRTRLAVVSGGYADGLMRALADSGFAFVMGVKVPLIGRVSMDSLVFDITELNEDLVQVGDMVEILGDNQSIDDLASMAGTIAYEMLTSIGQRYQRHYTNMPMGIEEVL